ncbi:unnamed protein product [Effrenium voratum]|nr:unnamed protein product [Effrenium voratum]
MSPKQHLTNGAWRVQDDKASTSAISQVGTSPWLYMELAAESKVGKIMIWPDIKQRAHFRPTKDTPILIGVSTKACTKDGCTADGTVCGKLITPRDAGPYVIDCSGRSAAFVWIQLPGKKRKIAIATIEIEKSATCEQVVFETKGDTKQCVHYDSYTAEQAAGEEGVTYTSAICHTAGKVGPPGVTGPEGQAGPAGPAGAKGPVGDKGDKGETGAIGEQGDVGPEGPEGKEADIAGLASMGQVNGAVGLCLIITIAVFVILLNKVSPKKGGGAAPAEGEAEGVEGVEGEGEEAYPEEEEQQY